LGLGRNKSICRQGAIKKSRIIKETKKVHTALFRVAGKRKKEKYSAAHDSSIKEIQDGAMIKNKLQLGMDAVLAEARARSDDDPTTAITILMAAAIYLQWQMGMSKMDFLKGASLQWKEISAFMESMIVLR
jgi:hypothetical protein